VISLHQAYDDTNNINRMQGTFVLYGFATSDAASTCRIVHRTNLDLHAGLTVRRKKEDDLHSTFLVKYGNNSELHSSIDAISISYMMASIEVAPHNQMYGTFELMETPKIEKYIHPVEDATTRSRIDLQTINYGDTQRMLVGEDKGESFEAFIYFGKLKDLAPDLFQLEAATLRFYFSGSWIDGTTIEMHQPDSAWRELGITHANKPRSVELLSSDYIIHKKERYIEFNVLHLLEKWQFGLLDNYGFILRSTDQHSSSFYTRESAKPPVLFIKYIPNLVYSVGRSAIDSTLFVYGVGHADRSARLTVHSSRGYQDALATLYVHQPADPMLDDLDSSIMVMAPDLGSYVVVKKRQFSDMPAFLVIKVKTASEMASLHSVTAPDRQAAITIDPNISKHCYVTVRKSSSSESLASLAATVPDIQASLKVSEYRRGRNDADASITVQGFHDSDTLSYLTATIPDLASSMTIKAYDESSLYSRLEVPYHADQETLVTATTPDLSAGIDIKYHDSVEATLYVKHVDQIDSTLLVKQISDLNSHCMVKVTSDARSLIRTTNPDLHGYLYPRVSGETDLDAVAFIRQRDAADLHCCISVSGLGGAYYFIL